ncbi:hypothetical protein [Denitratisoma oestradiolicum]|uniref:DUF4346 domain-containing protein n=1 Tax=Denitratisoma oestradiolicum TaxID=311182 RepID=A0A6S6XVT8_9PROT|nr:hypothetical protein [Denitratisoma oestradiolicum]TWO79008.1 hypothetical protein CBW56_16925 [Denitratisoma oestradiolicum]CAB1368333.1 conserved protein of unknown function [Denitratisoma oestradiolicum]
MNLKEIKEKYPDLSFEEIDQDESWEEDDSGYCFVIEAMPKHKKVRATVMVDDLPRVAFTGDSVGIRKMLVKWSINRDHLAYLAYELGRAEMALRDGSKFLQE